MNPIESNKLSNWHFKKADIGRLIIRCLRVKIEREGNMLIEPYIKREMNYWCNAVRMLTGNNLNREIIIKAFTKKIDDIHTKIIALQEDMNKATCLERKEN